MCLNSTPEVKQCTKCGETKPATNEYYARNKSGKYGLNGHCKACAVKITRAYRTGELKAKPKPLVADGYKICTQCGETNPATAEYFGPDKRRSDGLKSECRVCKNSSGRKYYQENREQVLERGRAYYADTREKQAERGRAYYKANRERMAEYQRAYYEENREYVNERNRAWYAANKKRRNERSNSYYAANKESHHKRSRAWRIANPERVAEYQRAYIAANPDVVRTRNNRRRALKRGAKGTHTAADIQAQYKRQKRRCYYCGIKVGKTYHVDHVVPLSRGGSDGPENIVIACPHCNVTKNDRLPHEWPQGGRLL